MAVSCFSRSFEGSLWCAGDRWAGHDAWVYMGVADVDAVVGKACRLKLDSFGAQSDFSGSIHQQFFPLAVVLNDGAIIKFEAVDGRAVVHGDVRSRDFFRPDHADHGGGVVVAAIHTEDDLRLFAQRYPVAVVMGDKGRKRQPVGEDVAAFGAKLALLPVDFVNGRDTQGIVGLPQVIGKAKTNGAISCKCCSRLVRIIWASPSVMPSSGRSG